MFTKAYTVEQGIVAPLDRANVDTDLIIPKQFLKSIKRRFKTKSGFFGRTELSCPG
jgi:3-isopropylmalate dehydratase small subunit